MPRSWRVLMAFGGLAPGTSIGAEIHGKRFDELRGGLRRGSLEEAQGPLSYAILGRARPNTSLSTQGRERLHENGRLGESSLDDECTTTADEIQRKIGDQRGVQLREYGLMFLKIQSPDAPQARVRKWPDAGNNRGQDHIAVRDDPLQRIDLIDLGRGLIGR